MKKINLKVATLEGVVYQDSIDSVSMPTTSGRIGILPGHTSIVSVIAPGEIFIEKDGGRVGLAVTHGFFEVRPSGDVVVMADTADHINDMSIEEIEKAKARVEKMLKNEENLHDVEFAYLENVLSREISRLKIAHKYHKRPH